MKRIFSFFMAAVMVFIMTPTLFADDVADYSIELIFEEGYLLDEDDRYVDFNNPADDSVPYGETVYYPLLSEEVTDSSKYDFTAVHETLAAKKVKIKTDWDEGSSYIDELSVVRKKFEGDLDDERIDTSLSKYVYFLSITTKQRSKTTTSTNEVYGTV
ncbi:MAG: hypothetical protein II995_06315, partial [Oscillospiraceae bacterium]|nr:hypothetical protein [Oscillospiraceae bacterium]